MTPLTGELTTPRYLTGGGKAQRVGKAHVIFPQNLQSSELSLLLLMVCFKKWAGNIAQWYSVCLVCKKFWLDPTLGKKKGKEKKPKNLENNSDSEKIN